MLAEMHNDASGIVFGMFSYSIMQSTSLIQWNTKKKTWQSVYFKPSLFHFTQAVASRNLNSLVGWMINAF